MTGTVWAPDDVGTAPRAHACTMHFAAPTPAVEYRRRLHAIAAQRYDAVCSGAGPAALSALDRELSACLAGFVGSAVTEIATLRAQHDGPNRG
jgi:hypothetical protein